MRAARWLRGYVRVQISGKGCGRFLNLCVRNGISLWQVRRSGEDRFVFCALGRDIWRMHPYLRKCRVHIAVQEKTGLPFLLFRYRRRIIFPLALLAVLLLFGYASRFVWRIEVIGNSSLTAETLTDYLCDRGAGLGDVCADIDCDRLELAIRQDFPQVIWASVSLEGTDMIVEIQEKVALAGEGRTATERTADGDRGRSGQEAALREERTVGKSSDSRAGAAKVSGDLVAACDGRVVSIITRRGTPLVKAGDRVKKGQILIRGEQDILDDSGQLKARLMGQADGDITGVVTFDYEDRIPEYQTRKDRGDSHVCRLSLEVLGKRLSLPLWGKAYKKSETAREYHQLRLTRQFYLPFMLTVSRSYEIEEHRVRNGPKEARSQAGKHLELYLKRLGQGGVEVSAPRVVMRKTGDTYRVTGKISGRCELGIRSG